MNYEAVPIQVLRLFLLCTRSTGRKEPLLIDSGYGENVFRFGTSEHIDTWNLQLLFSHENTTGTISQFPSDMQVTYSEPTFFSNTGL